MSGNVVVLVHLSFVYRTIHFCFPLTNQTNKTNETEKRYLDAKVTRIAECFTIFEGKVMRKIKQTHFFGHLWRLNA